MGLLSDRFSQKKQKNAFRGLKEKTLAWTIAGMAVFSPVHATVASAPRSSEKTQNKTEIVQDKAFLQQQIDSVTAKFEDYRLKDAAERMMKTKTGYAVLTELAKKNIAIETSSDISADMGGAYYPASKKIIINPSCSDDLIASILVHEGTHALQAANGCRLGPYLNAQSYINLNKAMEADAMKNQLFAAAELKELGDASVYNAFAREHKSLVKSYENLCTKYETQRDSVAKYTMLAYYNNHSYIKTYENRYIEALNAFYKIGQKNDGAGLFQINVSEAEIINRICHLNGKYYMNAADSVCLQDSARNYVSKGTYSSLEKLSKKHEKLLNGNTFFKPDSSYRKFHVVDYKGKVIQAPTTQKSSYMTKTITNRIKDTGR